MGLGKHTEDHKVLMKKGINGELFPKFVYLFGSYIAYSGTIGAEAVSLTLARVR